MFTITSISIAVDICQFLALLIDRPDGQQKLVDDLGTVDKEGWQVYNAL